MEPKSNVFESDPGAGSAQSHVIRGTEYIMSGSHDAAIAEFNRAIELDPKNEFAYAFRGSEYGKLGEWDKAISDYTHAIALNPKDGDYVSRGCAYFMVEKYNEARSDFEAALRLNPENTEAKQALTGLESVDVNYYFERGKEYLEKENYSQAIADFWKVMEMTYEPDKLKIFREKTKDFDPDVLAFCLMETLKQ